jgi:preprotein translocase SecE subunit
MLSFFKDSVRELKHVVWPTRQETKKYFMIVLSVLILFGVYLFIANTLFSEALFGLKDIFGGAGSQSSQPIFDPESIQIDTATGEIESASET